MYTESDLQSGLNKLVKDDDNPILFSFSLMITREHQSVIARVGAYWYSWFASRPLHISRWKDSDAVSD